MALQRLADVDLGALRPAGGYHPSPTAWEDQVFYFLMVDRFSDNRETGYKDLTGNTVTNGSTPLFQAGDSGNAVGTEEAARTWREAGVSYCQGTLSGITTKLGYLKRLGITALWISPVFKQVAFQNSYHGYGVQDFLHVNPRFGSDGDLKQLVRVAHDNRIYVILDIILNHTGAVHGYDPSRQPNYKDDDGSFDPRWDGSPYAVLGFSDKTGQPSIPFRRTDPGQPSTWPGADGAVWPVELQDPEAFTCKGRISSWDHFPEFVEGDFFSLKDVRQGVGGLDDYVPSAALRNLCRAYKYWMAFADIDGFRVDAVKHMDLGATRFLASEFHEFAQTLGKDNFTLIGEITGGRERAFRTLEQTGLDAALGIDDIPDKLEYLIKGYRNPRDYFSLFRNSELVNKDSHTWFRDKVVTVFDDHDQVRKGDNKARFCADPQASELVLNALALNATTLGIPCIYYGTEQGFDGRGGKPAGDRYIREAMFGGEFGAFRSRGRHFFDESNPIYRELARILEIRRSRLVLRRGRQFLRDVSDGQDGTRFFIPEMVQGQIRYAVAWSRILDEEEVVLAINTDYDQDHEVWVTLDARLNESRTKLRCLYSPRASQVGRLADIEARNGRAAKIMVPKAGFVIFEQA